MGITAAAVAIAAAMPVLHSRCTELRGAEILAVSMARLADGEAHLFCYRDQAGSAAGLSPHAGR
ncbi:MAG TPA: hypothetical protein VGI29_09210 [Candidatus Binataceae bacterium]